VGTLRNRLREYRRRAGLTQQALAELAGVTRQTVGGIEAGRYGPSVEVGLRLARALGCRVEDLFALEEPAGEVQAVGVGSPFPAPVRVALGEIAGRTVARPLTGLGALRCPVVAAHGVARGAGPVRVRPLPGAGRAVFLVGCDPALGLLAAHLARGPARMQALWWGAGNAAAVAQLRRGEAHAAGVHRPLALPGGPDLAADVPVVRFRLAAWETGWIVRPGNPKGIRGAEDLARADVVLANREPGSGARLLLDRLLAQALVPPERVRGYGRTFPGHLEAAEAVAFGLADVALGAGTAAAQLGLGFVPVTAEVCELWVPRDALDETPLQALLEVLQSGAFRADLAAFGPYDTAGTGARLD
jgi:putative molybdopterin biosynthesis protein